MDNRLKEALDAVHAEEELKERTRLYIAHKVYDRQRLHAARRRRLISAVACFLLFVLVGWGGHWLYFTPVSLISVDINPSFELEVNRFDKVISVDAYNDDGAELTSSMDLKFMDYSQALETILSNAQIAGYLAEDELLSIAVVGSDDAHCEQMLSRISDCTSGHQNTYCYAARLEDVDAAHSAGLSCGKYSAFLELQALDPSITVDEIQGMTMREIRDLIATLSEGSTTSVPAWGNGMGSGQGQHHGWHHAES